MRILLIGLSFFVSEFSFSQSYVYKRNIFTNELEVFKSQEGFPIGTPLYKIKKNLYGYLEIENLEASTNPFTQKPDYSVFNSRPLTLPIKEIAETLETLNKRYEFDYVTSNQTKITSSEGQEYAKNYFQKRSSIANAFSNFYSSNVSFPTSLTNGWYDVVNIFENEASSILGTEAGKDYKYGICKIGDNKIIEYYENCNILDLKTSYVFQKMKLEVSSPIRNCKSSFRLAGNNSYSTLYFLDNLLDSTKQISNPEFAYYSIYTSFNLPTGRVISVQLARNHTITHEEVTELKAGPYSATLAQSNPQVYDCNSSFLTLAFKKSTDKFSIGIYQTTEKFVGGSVWIVNDLSFTPSTCQSTSLTQ